MGILFKSCWRENPSIRGGGKHPGSDENEREGRYDKGRLLLTNSPGRMLSTERKKNYIHCTGRKHFADDREPDNLVGNDQCMPDFQEET